jgi:tetratricopeptide (TPR) repeat protein
MAMAFRWTLTPLVLLLATTGVRAQMEDRPGRHVPLKPTTRQELDRLEAIKFYGLAIVHQHNNRLLEAIRALEESRRLDPEAPAPYKALAPLYLAIDRVDDALAACRRALDLDPDEFDVAYLLSRQLRALDRPSEAVGVLEKAADRPGLKERPELRLQINLDLGLLQESAGRLDKAEAGLRQVADVLEHPVALLEQSSYTREEIDAQAAEVHERIGQICLRAGHADRAVAAFRLAQKKDPARAARLAFNLAKVYETQGKPTEALASLEAYLRSQPLGTDGYELQIQLLRRLDREREVVPALQAAAAKDGHNRALKLLLARECARAGKTADAEEIHKDLIKETPDADAYRGLFKLYQEQTGGADKILLQLDEAVKKAAPSEDDAKGDDDAAARDNAAARVRAMLQVLREADAAELVAGMLQATARQMRGGRVSLAYPTRMLLASLASRTRQIDLAEQLYRSCLDQPGGPRRAEQEVYSGLLRVLALAHKQKEIIAVCKRGLDQAVVTNRVLFHLELSQSYLALDRAKEALASADDAVRESGERERLFCRRNRVEVLAQLGQHDKAEAECQEMLKEYNQAGDVREVRLSLYSVYSAAKQLDKGEEQLRLVLQADPDDATANNDLGYQWADQNKNLEEAERLIRKALELDRRQRNAGIGLAVDADRDNAAYVDSLGWVLFRRGKLEDARRELEKAAALPSGADDPVVWDHLGDVLFRLDERDAARAAWEKAVKAFDAGHRRRDDRYREIKQKIKLLEQ